MHQFMQWQWSFAELVFEFLCDGGEVGASEPVEDRACECLVPCINSCSGSGLSLSLCSSFCATVAMSVFLSQWTSADVYALSHPAAHAIAVVFR